MAFNLPWFLFDLQNLQLITSPNIPIGEITDTKEIVLSEIPIPGLSYNPISTGGMGTRKITLTIPLVKINNSVGNVLLLKQFDNLRYQAFGPRLSNLISQSVQFSANPKVLYFWGAGNGVPLEYYVKRCDPVHRASFVNRFGNTQYSEIQLELWLDESSLLFKAEETFRKLASIAGGIQNLLRGPRSNNLAGR